MQNVPQRQPRLRRGSNPFALYNIPGFKSKPIKASNWGLPIGRTAKKVGRSCLGTGVGGALGSWIHLRLKGCQTNFLRDQTENKAIPVGKPTETTPKTLQYWGVSQNRIWNTCPPNSFQNCPRFHFRFHSKPPPKPTFWPPRASSEPISQVASNAVWKAR